MNAEVDGICNAAYGERTPERTNSRNGCRERDWDTRVGTIELRIPKLRQDSYYPDWLLEPRRRAEGALVAVVAELPAGGLHPPGGRPGQVARHRGHLQVPGLPPGGLPQRGRGRRSETARSTRAPTPTVCGSTPCSSSAGRPAASSTSPG